MRQEGFLDEDLCRTCGGKCCKSYPCANLPEDFGETEDEVKTAVRAAISTGRWAIDWWEGDPTGGNRSTACYVRPAVKGMEGRTHDPSWGGSCTFLSPTGCELSYEERPSGGRLLEAQENPQDCIIHGASKKEACIAWLPYNNWLRSFKKGEQA